MLDQYDKIQDACKFIRSQWGETPHAGIILGTGLGSLVQKLMLRHRLSTPTFLTFRNRRRPVIEGDWFAETYVVFR